MLIVDDEPAIVRMLEGCGREAGFEVYGRRSVAAAFATFRDVLPDVACIDVRMPDGSGLEFLRECRALAPDAAFIVITGFAGIDTAVDAFKLGAREFLPKPLEPERFSNMLLSLAGEWSRRRNGQGGFHGIVGDSSEMRRLFSTIRRIGRAASTVLVVGETGSGKELVARALHAESPRARYPFVAVNCAAITETLFESEVFGHVRGAFTGSTTSRPGVFEAADGGVLLLDEVGELPLTQQAKLLRVVETGEVARVGSSNATRVNVWIVAATNRDLRRAVADGRFRADLYYRLNAVEVQVPPLRARGDDVILLANHFLLHACERLARPLPGLTRDARDYLSAHSWPGNVRELRNVINQACMLTDSPDIARNDLSVADELSTPDESLTAPPRTPPRASPSSIVRFEPNLGRAERDHILLVLEEVDWNRSKAARALGISRRALYRRLRRHGLFERKFRRASTGGDNAT